MNILQPRDVINKGYLRTQIEHSSYQKFLNALQTLLTNVNEGQREETQKGFFKDFLRDSFYGDYVIDSSDNIDLAVRLNGNTSSNIGIMFEFKALGKPDMPTRDNINAKGLQELVLYYLRQRRSGNNDIRNLIITNTQEYFIFDAQVFENYFYKNNSFYKKFVDFEEGRLTGTNTSHFYNEVAAPYIQQIQEQITFTYFNLKNYKVDIRNQSQIGKLPVLYRIFSPVHLLKEKFQNDSNSLNEKFYKELLHLIGLEEKNVNSKSIIQRKPKNEREAASLLENAMEILKYECSKNPGETDDEFEKRLFHIAMELCILWVNRVLFLKLLEAQLLNYHNQSYIKFLTYEKIKDFDTLYRLFFHVLAIDTVMRSGTVKAQFPNVPYLNSSLFEISEVEKDYCKINGLSQSENITIMRGSVLKNDISFTNKDSLPFLEYLFAFLDAYNFSSEGTGEVAEQPKTLINASVLGLIFEKINGYKDGAVFTPGFITKYMCETALRQTVVNKFNEKTKSSLRSFDELLDSDYDRKEINDIINSLTICDPAVGSGHFLVSALNEIILIKYQLNCLFDTKGNRIKKTDYEFSVENDELIITDSEGELWKYNPRNVESRRIQEALFNEKRTIIENCLFGVDINQNSVNICRLRLWIELLKNAYYTEESQYTQLETLPNIDINIKCGNSLLNKLSLKDAITNSDIKKYKTAVKNYKSIKSKSAKKEIIDLIKEIKSDFSSEICSWMKVVKDYEKARKEYNTLQEATLFDDTKTARERRQDEKRKQKAKKILDNAKIKLDAAINNQIYKHGFEWRLEFPEILNDTGKFEGFDLVIGNPPYGVSIKDQQRFAAVKSYGNVPDFEIYYFFIELAKTILREGGILSYIIPNTWLFNHFASNYRKSMFNDWLIFEILDLTKIPVFTNVGVRNTILFSQRKSYKDENSEQEIDYRCTRDISTFNEFISQPKQKLSSNDLLKLNQNWGLAFFLPLTIISIINKISDSKNKLIDFYDVSQGYIPYRLSDLIKKYGIFEGKKILEERKWHSSTKLDDSYIQEIYGANITKYEHHSTGEYVKYGRHLATYVDLKYFNNERLLVREITNPNIVATYITRLYINDPQLISIIKKEGKNMPLLFLWAVLNSKLATFYHFNHSPKATKGLFPKILVTDIKEFPIPEVEDETALQLETLVKEILNVKKENAQADISLQENEIDRIIYKLYDLTYDEIKIVDPNTTLTRRDYNNFKL